MSRFIRLTLGNDKAALVDLDLIEAFVAKDFETTTVMREVETHLIYKDHRPHECRVPSEPIARVEGVRETVREIMQKIEALT